MYAIYNYYKYSTKFFNNPQIQELTEIYGYILADIYIPSLEFFIFESVVQEVFTWLGKH